MNAGNLLFKKTSPHRSELTEPKYIFTLYQCFILMKHLANDISQIFMTECKLKLLRFSKQYLIEHT